MEPTKRDQIAAHLLSEHALGRIPIAIRVAEKFSVSRPYVHQVRSSLIQAGQLPVSPRGRGGAPDETRLQREEARKARNITLRAARAQRDAQTAALEALKSEPISKIMEHLDEGAAPMSTDEKRAFLSELARLTMREEIKVQAISALNRLDSTLRVEDNLGPRAPLSLEEANARISDLERARRDVFGLEA